jgi:LysR family carnitine catabolism transcriptional activator
MRAGIAVRPAHEVGTSNLPVIGALVAAGVGLSVLPASTLACLNQSSLVARRLAKPRIERKVGIVTLSGRTLSLATAGFCEHLLHLSDSPVSAVAPVSRAGKRQASPARDGLVVSA